MCPVQNEIIMEAMDAKSDVKPNKSFRGKSVEKSLSSYREVRIERNKTMEVIEKQRATSDEMEKALNAVLSMRIGTPVF